MGKFLPLPLVRQILKENQDQLFVLGESKKSDLLVYNPQKGVFEPGERQVRLRAKALMGSLVKQQDVEEVFKLVHLAAPRKSPEEFDANRNVITFANGVLKVRQNELVPFSPKFLCRTRIPNKYQRNATCPKVDKFLSEVLAPEYHRLVEEFLGCALVGDVRHEKCLLMLGPGSNGKTVLLKVAQKMVGSENVANVPLQELADKQFYRAEIAGKRLNIFADIDRISPKHLGTLKALISGDWIQADRKYKDPFSFSNSAVLIFSCNQLPEFQERTYAIQRRFVAIPFENIFKGTAADKTLFQKLIKPGELAGFINRALRGYRRWLRKGKFSIPEGSREILRRHFENGDSVAMFVKERTYEISDSRVSKVDLYSEYRNYCTGDDWTGGLGVKPVSRNQFNSSLRQLRPSVREGKMSSNDRRDTWIGLSLHPPQISASSEETPRIRDFFGKVEKIEDKTGEVLKENTDLGIAPATKQIS